MLNPGPAKKITIYLNEDSHARHEALYKAILSFLLEQGVAGATVTRALAGYGAHHVVHTARIEALAEHLPIKIEFIESAEKVEAVIGGLSGLVTDGMIEMQDTTVVKIAAKGSR